MKYLMALLILVLLGCRQQETLLPISQELRYSIIDETRAGVLHHSPFAAYVLRPAPATITITAITTYTPAYIEHANVTVYTDGHYFKTLPLTTAFQLQDFEVAVPSGVKELVLVEGATQRANERDSLEFTTITSISYPKSNVLQMITSGPTNEAGLFAFTDSRGQGGGYPEGGRYSWPVQLRAKRLGTDVLVGGYCSLQLGEHIGTAQKRTALTAQIKKALSPYAKQALWIEAGTNDFGFGTYSPAQLLSFYQQWLPELHKALPTLTVFLQTDIDRADMNINKLGLSLANYQIAETQAGAGLPYVQIVDGRRMSSTKYLADKVHLTALGDGLFAEKVDSVLKKWH